MRTRIWVIWEPDRKWSYYLMTLFFFKYLRSVWNILCSGAWHVNQYTDQLTNRNTEDSEPRGRYSDKDMAPTTNPHLMPNVKNKCCHTPQRPGLAQSLQRLARGWKVRESNPGGREISRTSPDWPWGPTSFLYNGCRVTAGGTAAGAWRWPSIPSSAEVKERV